MRLKRGEKGQAVVELALVMTLLLLILLGIATFGQMMNASLTLTYASREGARAAALGGTDLEVHHAILGALSVTLDPVRVTTTVQPAQGSRPRGTPITVKVTYPVEIEVPLIARTLGRNQIVLLGTTTMRSEV